MPINDDGAKVDISLTMPGFRRNTINVFPFKKKNADIYIIHRKCSYIILSVLFLAVMLKKV
jgi:hypothetical protein